MVPIYPGLISAIQGPPNGKPTAGVFEVTFPARRDLADAARGITFPALDRLIPNKGSVPILLSGVIGALIAGIERVLRNVDDVALADAFGCEQPGIDFQGKPGRLRGGIAPQIQRRHVCILTMVPSLRA